MLKTALLVLAALCLSASAGLSSVPMVMSYQGRLTDSSGQTITNGNHNMRFYLYDAVTSGNLLWQEPANGSTARLVPVEGGLFSVLLGSLVALPEAAFQGNTYLQVEVNGSTLLPRTQIVSTGYAVHALSADKIPDASVTSAKLASSCVTNSKIAGKAITPDKLNTEMASRGQVLTFDGELAAWADPVPLALPYATTVSSASTALAITNTGTGRAANFTINNTANSINAVYATSNGTGTTAYVRNSGSGNAVVGSVTGSSGSGGYFETTGANNASVALSALSAGTGSAAAVTLNNAASMSAALDVTTNGIGPVIHGDTAASGNVIDAATTGTGKAGYFLISNAGSNSAAVYSTTNGTASGYAVYGRNSGLGEAGYFEITNSSNSKPAMDVFTSGTGVGGLFTVSNASNSQPALQASTSGTGPAFQAAGNTGVGITTWAYGSQPTVLAYAYGTGGEAGHFEVTNYNSNAMALHAVSNGTGPAMYAKSTGMGEAGHFEVANSNSGSSALYATTNGKAATANISNNGLGEAGHFEVTNSSSGYSAIYAKTTGSGAAINAKAGTGKAAYLDGAVEITGKVTSSATSGYLPAAFGRVDSSGAKLSGTPNFTVTRFYEGIYGINFNNFSYNDTNYTAIVTANVLVSSGTRTATAYKRMDGMMGVLIQDSGGGAKDCAFSFVVYGNP